MTAEASAKRTAPWRRPPTERERQAERIERRLQPFISALGIVFLLVILGQILAAAGTLQSALTWTAWLLWSVFVFEYSLRVVIAPSTWGYLRRTWWQILLLAVPFLSFLRLIAFVRIGRAARIVSSSIRASRTSAQALTDRLVWLGLVHAIVVLGAAESLLEFGRYTSFASALHDAAYAATTGEPFSESSPVGNVLEVVLAMYSVAVFAALAGSIGAFLLDRERAKPPHRLVTAERPET